MTAADLDRALAVLRAIARDRATSVVPVPGGEVVLHRDLPLAHDHNRVLVSGPCDAADAGGRGGAGVPRRRARAPAGRGPRRLGAAGRAARPRVLAGAGHGRRAGARPGGAGRPARPGRAGPRRHRHLAGGQPGLGRGAAEAARGAGPHRAGRGRHDVPGRAGRVGQRRRPRRPVRPRRRRPGRGRQHRPRAPAGSGLASRLVLEGVRRASAAGADLVFLVADADDWPQHLYRRLGFTDLGAYRVLRADAPS